MNCPAGGLVLMASADRPGPREEPPTRTDELPGGGVAEPAGDPPAPELHPGTPPWMRTTYCGLRIVRHSEKATLFERPNGGRAWMPKKAIRYDKPPANAVDPRVDVSMPVWLYNEVRPKLARRHRR